MSVIRIQPNCLPGGSTRGVITTVKPLCSKPPAKCTCLPSVMLFSSSTVTLPVASSMTRSELEMNSIVCSAYETAIAAL